MAFKVILKQLPDNHCPNHFKYQCLVAFSTRLDEDLITASLNSIMDSLIKTNQTHAEIDANYFVFKLENVEDCFEVIPSFGNWIAAIPAAMTETLSFLSRTQVSY